VSSFELLIILIERKYLAEVENVLEHKSGKELMNLQSKPAENNPKRARPKKVI
jgi:hypothetical protein